MLHALEAGNVAALSVALEFGPWDEAPPPDPRDLLRSVGVSGSLDCLAVMAEAGDLLPPCPREAREGPWAECVMAAAVHGHLPMLEVLCAWMGGALPDEWPGGRTLAHAAARGGRREVLHWLLSDRGSRQLRFVDDQGRSVLHEACEGPDPEGTLRALLANRGMRALVNAREARRARTALHLAARRGDAGAVRLLLGVEGTEAAPRDHRGCTPLVLALMGGHEVRGEGVIVTAGCCGVRYHMPAALTAALVNSKCRPRLCRARRLRCCERGARPATFTGTHGALPRCTWLRRRGWPGPWRWCWRVGRHPMPACVGLRH